MNHRRILATANFSRSSSTRLSSENGIPPRAGSSGSRCGGDTSRVVRYSSASTARVVPLNSSMGAARATRSAKDHSVKAWPQKLMVAAAAVEVRLHCRCLVFSSLN